MGEEEAFRQAIAEAPEDDTPRLVYADWLEEHGRADHGRFIRLHIAWCRQDPDKAPDEDLKRSLIAAWESSGLAGASPLSGVPHVYDRGLPAGVRFEGHDLLRGRVEAVCQSAPVRVALFCPIGDINAAWLAESPLLARLAGLCCADSAGVVGQVLASPSLAGLDLLHVAVGGTEEAVEAAWLIASARHLDTLTVLDLDGSHIGDEGLDLLAEADHLRSVRKLTMRSDGRVSHDIEEAGIRALTGSRSLTQLTHLDFCDCGLGGDALQWLLGWAGATQLVELNLCFTQLDGADVVALARCRRLRNLQRLCLSPFELNDEALRALADHEALPALRELRIEAVDEYGEWDDQTPEALSRLADQLGPRLTLGTADSRAFELSPVGEADRIWQRLRRLGEPDERGLGLARIL